MRNSSCCHCGWQTIPFGASPISNSHFASQISLLKGQVFEKLEEIARKVRIRNSFTGFAYQDFVKYWKSDLKRAEQCSALDQCDLSNVCFHSGLNAFCCFRVFAIQISYLSATRNVHLLEICSRPRFLELDLTGPTIPLWRKPVKGAPNLKVVFERWRTLSTFL